MGDGESVWHPSEFYGHDSFLHQGDTKLRRGLPTGQARPTCPFPPDYLLGSGSGSSVASPVESFTGIDEEEYMAGLTRQMAYAFLRDNPKGMVMAGSPQSTLCGAGTWSLSSRGGSPDQGRSLASSPTGAPFEAPKDLLSAAAAQVMLMRLREQAHAHARAAQVMVTNKPTTPAGGFYPDLELTHHQQLQIAQFYHLKQQLLIKQHLAAAAALERENNKSRVVGAGQGDGRVRPLGLSSSAWPPLQKQQTHQKPVQARPAGSGMTAVFLNGAGAARAKRESAGTGVFIPRRSGSPAGARKKPACSTVFLPARVVQALNLGLDDVQLHPNHAFDCDAAVGWSNSLPVTHRQKRSPPLRHQPPATACREVRLPQEWTY